MKQMGYVLDERATQSLADLLTSEVLGGVSRISVANVLYGQKDNARVSRRQGLPSMQLCTGIHMDGGPYDKPYVYPGIALVLEGRVDVSIGDELYLAREGDWMIFSEQVPHLEFCVPSHPHYRMFWFQFIGDECKLAISQYSEKGGFQVDMFGVLGKPPFYVGVRALNILRNPGQPASELRRHLVHIISWWLLTLDAKTGQQVVQMHPLVERVQALLDDPETISLSVTDLARQLGLSLNYVSASFHKATGKTLREAIQEKKVVQARKLLADTSIPIKEIASRLGYADSQHFNHAFRRTEGMSPSMFRQVFENKSDK